MKSKSVERVQQYLDEHVPGVQVVTMPSSTRTATEAAGAVGAPLGSIVKSLVFIAAGAPILALVSGDRRADEAHLAAYLGLDPKDLRRATADEVRTITGFAIGGVPPVAHARPLRTLIDRGLARYEIVYAAAGHPHTLFPIPYRALMKVTGGEVTDLA